MVNWSYIIRRSSSLRELSMLVLLLLVIRRAAKAGMILKCFLIGSGFCSLSLLVVVVLVIMVRGRFVVFGGGFFQIGYTFKRLSWTQSGVALDRSSSRSRSSADRVYLRNDKEPHLRMAGSTAPGDIR